VLAVPEGNPKGIESFDQLAELLKAGDVFMAMGNSDVPVGQYTQKILDFYGLNEEELAKAGCKELILIAQDTTYYGYDLYGELRLAKLLKKLCRIDGIEWIRLMYCYEDRITDELIQVMAEEPKICHYLDIPIQHASDSVLKAMNRRSTIESIKGTMARLKAAMPDIHVRTTLIVGFPGETEEDYDQLVEFVEDERFARLGVFAYSQEEGTEAGDREDQIDDEIKEVRLDGIMRRQLDISLGYNQEKVGQVFEVMVDEIDEDGSYLGRTRYDAPEIDNSVIFTSDKELKPGDIVHVMVNDAFDYDLVGREVE
jgi:ribosomal protein S12 methylthiotransferase